MPTLYFEFMGTKQGAAVLAVYVVLVYAMWINITFRRTLIRGFIYARFALLAPVLGNGRSGNREAGSALAGGWSKGLPSACLHRFGSQGARHFGTLQLFKQGQLSAAIYPHMWGRHQVFVGSTHLRGLRFYTRFRECLGSPSGQAAGGPAWPSVGMKFVIAISRVPAVAFTSLKGLCRTSKPARMVGFIRAERQK